MIVLTGKPMIIYEALNIINNKRYIGQTIQTLHRRKQQYINSIKYNNSKCIAFVRAMKKYGVENFKWRIVDDAETLEELDKKESYWIEYYDTTNPNKGYNLKGGGHNPYLTEEVKKKIGDAQRGELNHMYGKTGKYNKSSKPVLCITTGKQYYSASDCAKDMPGFDFSKICAVCRGDRYTYKKHIFRYIDSNGDIVDNGKPVSMDEIKEIKRKISRENWLKGKNKDCWQSGAKSEEGSSERLND